jgi:hypothetical protein
VFSVLTLTINGSVSHPSRAVTCHCCFFKLIIYKRFLLKVYDDNLYKAKQRRETRKSRYQCISQSRPLVLRPLCCVFLTSCSFYFDLLTNRPCGGSRYLHEHCLFYLFLPDRLENSNGPSRTRSCNSLFIGGLKKCVQF